MWFKSLSKAQFSLYAKQEAKLDMAYWLAALVQYKCENEAPTTIILSEITNFKRQVREMLRHAYEDIEQLHGLPAQLIKHQLGFTVKSCRQSLKDTNKRFRCIRQGIEMPGDNQLMEREMAWIKERAELLDADDLLEQWNRSIYLIYGAITLDRTRLSVAGYRDQLKRRLDAAVDLMSPGHKKVKQYCQSYIGHLDLEPIPAMLLVDQQIGEYSRLFEAGLALARHSTSLLSTNHRFVTRGFDQKDLDKYLETIDIRANHIHERLTHANLMRANTIRRALDRNELR